MDVGRGPTGQYELARPTLDDAHTALRGLYGPHTDDVWRNLLSRSGLTGQESDLDSFDRLVSFMAAAEPITRLCGRSLGIRASSYRQLAAADKAPAETKEPTASPENLAQEPLARQEQR